MTPTDRDVVRRRTAWRFWNGGGFQVLCNDPAGQGYARWTDEGAMSRDVADEEPS